MTLPTLIFLGIVAAVVGAWLSAIAAARALTVPQRAAVAAAVLLLGLVVPAGLAARGSLDRYAPLPAPALVLVATVTFVNLALMMSRVGSALVNSVGLAWLVGFQAFRIPVEWWLHRAFEDGIVPVQMTYAGRNFDIVSGFTGLLLGLWLVSGRPSRRLVLAWNVLGLALLFNIVIVAVLSTPTSFRVFINGPANLLPSTFPFVWLPTFLVQAALAGHVLVFRALASRTTVPRNLSARRPVKAGSPQSEVTDGE